MLVPLVLPALNISSSLYPNPGNITALAPNAPDTWNCDPFYARNGRPDITSCMRLINQLPQGSVPIRYYIHPVSIEEVQHSLPIVVGRRSERCQIQVHISGPDSDHGPNPILINPKTIRDLAASLIWHCVGGEQRGGAITTGIIKSLHWLTALDTEFPGPAPERTTFISLHVWTPGREIVAWNPGNQDPGVGQAIWNYVYEIYHSIPTDSPRHAKLDEVLFDLLHSTTAMDYGSNVNWFDDKAPPLGPKKGN